MYILATTSQLVQQGQWSSAGTQLYNNEKFTMRTYYKCSSWCSGVKALPQEIFNFRNSERVLDDSINTLSNY